MKTAIRQRVSSTMSDQISQNTHMGRSVNPEQKTLLEQELTEILNDQKVDATIIDQVQNTIGTILFEDISELDNATGIEDKDQTSAIDTVVENQQSGALTVGFDLFEGDELQGTEDLIDFPSFDSDRYVDKGPLGAGSMGEVRLLFDRRLNRDVACKTINVKLQSRPGILSRFIEEAQVVSQLQHPNIVPIHEIGIMPNGAIYFTMQVIRGKPFSKFIEEVHEAIDESGWQPTASGWGFHRLIDVFVQICETMHFAHSKGVIHRDLKPDNIMIGEYGEVLVVDWGVCKIVGQTHKSEEQIESTRFDEGIHATRVGQITGTPAYMPPEQAKGDIDALDNQSDIYALGAILYHIISGLPPYTGKSGKHIITQVLTGPPNPVRNTLVTRTATAFGKSMSQLSMNTLYDEEVIIPESPNPVIPADFSGPPISMELVKACEKAMSRDMNKRHETARDLANVIKDWREGTKRTQKADMLSQEAMALTSVIDGLETAGRNLITTAKKTLFHIPRWESFDKKSPQWKAMKMGQDSLEEAAKMAIKKENLLENALMHRSDHLEANSEMLKHLKRTHQSMEESISAQAVAKRMEGHLEALSEADPLRIEIAKYLSGTGTVTLVTDVEGAEVYISTIREVNRLLVETDERYLGKTPILNQPLEMGSYLLTIRKEGYHVVRYPVFIDRNEEWAGIAPGESEPHPIHLPPLGTLEEGTCYVPAGWFTCGGDPHLPNCFPKTKVWVDGFVMGQYHVTVPEYMACVNDLLSQGKREVVDDILPGIIGMPFVKTEKDGSLGFSFPQFEEFDFSEMPMVWLDSKCGLRYMEWLRGITGKPWRLPYEMEFEKAARGVDKRQFPMGNHFDPTWIFTDDTPAYLPAGKNQYPRDRSIYGLRYMAGNVADWLLGKGYTHFPVDPQGRHLKEYDAITEPPPELSCRAGGFLVNQRYTRCTYRQFYPPEVRALCVGIRMARPIIWKSS